MDLFLRDLDSTLQSRIAAYRYLWDRENWRNFVLVFTGTDRLAHFLWDAYMDTTHHYHDAFLDHFRKIDNIIGEIAERLHPDDGLMLCSDHGFESLKKCAYVNRFLKELGFLILRSDPARSYKDMGEETTAFALDPARIYIHSPERYPGGHVKKEDRDAIIYDLIQAFLGWEIKGEKVIDRIYHRDDIYHGPYIENAPDLVLISRSGFELRARLKTAHLCGNSSLTGKHTQHDAFLIVKGEPEIPVPENPSVTDVTEVFKNL